MVTDAGTDLDKVREYILGENYLDNCIILENKFSEKQLNYLYNIADVQILLTSNEGWGLTITEAMLSRNTLYSKCYRWNARPNEICR